MSSRLLFISDLHLEESRPDITASLIQFLADNQGRCDSLYILGDLFEMWIGDDEGSELSQQVAAALKAFSANGAAIYLMHGNRDFLIGEEFAHSCGAKMLQDPTVVESDVGPLLLSHGDSLCTDDVDYLQFRSVVRQPTWQQDFLAKSLDERRAFAQQAREQSKAATRDKAMEIMDVNQEAVQQLLAAQGQTTLIHGHTHRPDKHQIELQTAINGCSEARRIVLGDWHQRGWYVEVDNSGIHLQQFPLQDS